MKTENKYFPVRILTKSVIFLLASGFLTSLLAKTINLSYIHHTSSNQLRISWSGDIPPEVYEGSFGACSSCNIYKIGYVGVYHQQAEDIRMYRVTYVGVDDPRSGGLLPHSAEINADHWGGDLLSINANQIRVSEPVVVGNQPNGWIMFDNTSLADVGLTNGESGTIIMNDATIEWSVGTDPTTPPPDPPPPGPDPHLPNLDIETAIAVSFPTLEGETYILQVSTDLENWSDYATGIVGDGTTKRYFFLKTEPRRYYRLKAPE